MSAIRNLVENQVKLNYSQLCGTLIEEFGCKEEINWDSVLPQSQQQGIFGGEILRLIADHPKIGNLKDIRPISLMKGDVSQLLFFFVRLNEEHLSKNYIQKITSKFIRGKDASRYIIWFFGNKDETELKVVLSGKDGKRIVLKSLSFGINQPYFKTYDFIFSEVQNKLNQLFVEPMEFWDALWKAFNISIVNKNFYSEIKSAFDALIEQLSQKGNPFKTDQERVQFCIRLIGRIIFCWFLKRKGILHNQAISSEAVKNNSKNNYYHDLLEILFFDVLNTPPKERKGGIPKIISHYPFLNGGLFDAQIGDYKANLRVSIDNLWFEKFFGTTLERYNFTVDENSSSNAEIAIDPEMLGRIFENLLAEQNPETGESARKSTGSFYTPREVVDYMVEQSVSEYLKNYFFPIDEGEEMSSGIENDLFGAIPNQQLKISEIKSKVNSEIETVKREAIEEFVNTQHIPELLASDEDIKKLMVALNEIRVLDPACGSGAFPIGILQKLVGLKNELLQSSSKRQMTSAKMYSLKLSTIQNSIYGVDIQPMAVELSRLRCWLSLVVDEENDDIKALPNLDFKFICANSLIDVPTTEYTKVMLGDTLKQLEKNVAGYFTPDFKEKKKLHDAIQTNIDSIIKVNDAAIKQIIKELRKEKPSASPGKIKQRDAELLRYNSVQAKWKSYENIFTNQKADFFSLKYFFPSVKDGFDIVIGNPPYVQLQKFEEATKTELESQNYKTYSATGDIYQLFYERGVQLLKRGGNLCYITSNKWMRTGYGEVTRKYFTEETNPLCLIDFAGHQVFETATVDTNILILQRAAYKNETQTCIIGKEVSSLNNLSDYFRQKAFSIKFNSTSWVVLDSMEMLVKQKIEKIGVPLKEWDIRINYGIKTGFNGPLETGGCFIITKEKRDELIKKCPKAVDIIRPILRGRDIEKYKANWAKLFIIYIPWHFPLQNDSTIKGVSIKAESEFKRQYPAVYEHLLQYKEELSARNKAETGIRYEWYALQRWGANYMDDFSKHKIIYPNMTKYLPFIYDTEGYFLNDKGFIITGENIAFLTAFFNSSVFKFCFRENFPELQGGTRELRKIFLDKIPVLQVTKEQNKMFESKITKVQRLKVEGKDTVDLETELDHDIFDLYNLTKEERKAIGFIMIE